MPIYFIVKVVDSPSASGWPDSKLLCYEIGAHAPRATAATNALDHQADIAKVQEWLGHANIATTRIYYHRNTPHRLYCSPAVTS